MDIRSSDVCEVAEDFHLKDFPIEYSQNIACGAASGGVRLNFDLCATCAQTCLLRRHVCLQPWHSSCQDNSPSPEMTLRLMNSTSVSYNLLVTSEFNASAAYPSITKTFHRSGCYESVGKLPLLTGRMRDLEVALGFVKKKCNRNARSQVLTSLNMKVRFFWNVMPYNLVDPYQLFEGR